MTVAKVPLVEPDKILASSRRWMTAGLAAFSRDDGSEDFVVHHIGVAMEHLLKAYLAFLHPAHIVEDKNWESLLHATGHADRSRILRSRTKTIGLGMAFERVKKLIPQIKVTPQEFEPVLAARNGVAHVGHHDEAEVRAVLTTVIRLAVPVLTAIEQLRDASDRTEDYWGDYRQLRDHLLDERTTELRLALTAKIAGAKRTFLDRLAGIGGRQRTVLIDSIGAHDPYPFAADHEQRAESCPACEGRGWLRGSVDFDWEPDEDGGSRIATFHPDGYDCAVCGLSLGAEEIALLELDNPIALPEADVYELMEPDEDLYRDR